MATAKKAQRPTLTVTKREAVGSRPIRRLRSAGQVPGVVYGRDMKPVSVLVTHRDLIKLLHSSTGEHSLVTLKLDGGGSWEKPVLVQDIQHDPVDGRPVHVDFHAILLTERLKVKVPLVLKGEPMGVKQEGGILEQFLREIEVECLPTEIPAHVEFDVTALSIGNTIHVSDLTAPANAKITSEPEGAVAAVLAPKVEKPEEAAEAVTEPEVIREKKEEPEAEGEGEAKGAAKGGEAKAEDAKGGGKK